MTAWVMELEHGWVVDYLSNILDHASGIVGGHYSLGWWMTQSTGTEHSEFAERTELHTTKDARLYTATSDSDFDLLFHFPIGRKHDTVPGWYQKYEATFSVPLSGEMSFEWDAGACSKCNESEELVMEVQISEQVTSWSTTEYWQINKDYSSGTTAWQSSFLNPYVQAEDEDGNLLYDSNGDPVMEGLTLPTPPTYTFSGAYDIDVVVYLYTVDNVDSRRDIYFRMTDPGRTNPETVLGVTYDVPETIYSISALGLWTSFEAGILPSSTNLSVLPADHNPDYFNDAWKQADYMVDCLGDFYTGNISWELTCQ